MIDKAHCMCAEMKEQSMAEPYVCPVWVGYLLVNPLRKFLQNPEKILSPYVNEGMTVLDIGCAMGFFSLPLAKMLGSEGKVICVDLQEEMIKALEKRARKAGLLSRIETRVCGRTSLKLSDLNGEVDLALAFAVVHEVPDTNAFFSEIHTSLKPDGKLFVSEPKAHVSENDFNASVSVAEQNGFKVIERPGIGRSLSVVLGK